MMTPGRTSILRVLYVAAVLLCTFGRTASGASDWEVIKVGRWDYLAVDNIAKFYDLPGEVAPINKTIRLDNGRNQLEVTLDSREAVVNGVRTWLCFPVIAHTDGRYLVSRIDLAKSFEPQFRPQMIPSLGRFTTVVLDPGHGGVEKGATNSYGTEKDFALDVALQLKPMLEAKGLKVVMTRDSDIQVPLPERARIANNTKDCIFVSIHFNATDSNPSASGFEIFSLTPRGAPSTQDNALAAKFAHMQAGSPVDAASLALSMSVYHSMLGYLPEFDRGIKRARFAVLRLTKVPAILVEGGFISERQQSRLIANKEWRGRLAQSIGVGIDNYRQLVEKKQRPMLLADYRRQFGDGVLIARDASAPGATTPSPIFAASNPQAGAGNYQVTAPVRREPSAQIDIAKGSIPPAPASGPPSAEVAAAIGQANSEAADPDEGHSTHTVFPPDEAPAADSVAAVAQPAQDQPPPQPELVASEAAADAPPAAPVESAAPSVAPTPRPVRKHWILNFDPPPKFRQ
ncbi:MAG: N-acetylmuramoyl-L-alanine amidase [Chthoniobacterales bacterium]|nr:N-acetylmuramoyl-L-alanine amidase [Chthoniobacterales bacterium]